MEQDKRQLLPFFLCTASVMLILTGMLGIFSLFPYLYTRSLTAAHAEEFKRFLESSGLPEGENAEIRVLRYRKNRARVSFLSADGKRESVCTFLREDRASGDGTPSHAKGSGWILSSRRIIRESGGDYFSGILRSYLRMIGC